MPVTYPVICDGHCIVHKKDAVLQKPPTDAPKRLCRFGGLGARSVSLGTRADLCLPHTSQAASRYTTRHTSGLVSVHYVFQDGTSGACAKSAGLHRGWFRPDTTSDEVARYFPYPVLRLSRSATTLPSGSAAGGRTDLCLKNANGLPFVSGRRCHGHTDGEFARRTGEGLVPLGTPAEQPLH